MAKDPAFLFYPGDFLGGTQFFTDDQLGKYVRLLIAQFNTGHLYDQDMMMICGKFDERIFSKFIRDDKGRYFNKRLETEMEKRKSYSLSRSNNRRRGIIRESSDQHMNTHDSRMENENENIKGDARGKTHDDHMNNGKQTVVPEKFKEAAYNKSMWTDEYWREFYAKRISKDPEFSKYFEL